MGSTIPRRIGLAHQMKNDILYAILGHTMAQTMAQVHMALSMWIAIS